MWQVWYYSASTVRASVRVQDLALISGYEYSSTIWIPGDSHANRISEGFESRHENAGSYSRSPLPVGRRRRTSCFPYSRINLLVNQAQLHCLWSAHGGVHEMLNGGIGMPDGAPNSRHLGPSMQGGSSCFELSNAGALAFRHTVKYPTC